MTRRAPAGGGESAPGAGVFRRPSSRLPLPPRATPRIRGSTGRPHPPTPTPTVRFRPGGRGGWSWGGGGWAGPPPLTQRAAMRALHHPRQNNSDRQSLPSPAELCAGEGPAWAAEISVERQGEGATGVGNRNPSPGMEGLEGFFPPPGQKCWNPKRLCARPRQSPSLGLNTNQEENKRAIENCFHPQAFSRSLPLGGTEDGWL